MFKRSLARFFPIFTPSAIKGNSSVKIVLPISSILVTPNKETLIDLYFTLSSSLILVFSISLLRMLLKK